MKCAFVCVIGVESSDDVQNVGLLGLERENAVKTSMIHFINKEDSLPKVK